MCYSAQIERNITRYEKIFGAKIDPEAMVHFRFTQGLEHLVGAEEIKAILGLSRKPRVSQFRWAPEEKDCRIYPGTYFAPVIVWSSGRRVIVPMRYRVRPAGMPVEVPSKYNVFNARVDSLQKRSTWKKLFGHNHALLPFLKFFEWVERDGIKIQVSFTPEGRDIMWAPALFDTWTSSDSKISFSSFALITDDPPPEVSDAGHDRCPIFLRRDLIDDWLQPMDKSQQTLLEILKHREPTFFGHKQVSSA